MCQNCEKVAFAAGARSAMSELVRRAVRGTDLATGAAEMKVETRAMAEAEGITMDDEELSALDAMIDTAAAFLASTADDLRATAERMSPTVPATPEGIIP